MLSKLRYRNSLSEEEILSLRKGISPAKLLASLKLRNCVINKIEHGTLSAAFIVHADSRSFFLKTHLTSDGRVTLSREIAILKQLYGEVLPFVFQDLRDPDSDRLWLMMPIFEKNQTPLNPEQVIKMLGDLDMGCALKPYHKIIDVYQDNIKTLIEAAEIANANLSKTNLLEDRAQAAALSALGVLDKKISSIEPILCHGDLSPVNIMRHKSRPILIDWEDCFLGVRDYDYLYWLTFFENRKLYSSEPLRYISIDREIAKSILVLIVLLKCELSWRRKNWQHNSMNFSDRILEICNLR